MSDAMMHPDLIRVVIVDDHPMFREGVRQTLVADPGILVVGEGASADDALQLSQELLPDVLLLDISMPGGGLNAANQVCQACPVIRIAMLTVSENDDDVMLALKAGAAGYVLKGVSSTGLINIVKSLHRGEMYVSPSLAARILSESRSLASEPSTVEPQSPVVSNLTGREEEILKHIAQGMSNREIGEILNIAEKTVKNYVTNVFQKLQVRNRVEAAIVARRRDNC
ncbi:MAG: LuxR C-terminal-related transcriptional regulator [Granulosicoccus sp.]